MIKTLDDIRQHSQDFQYFGFTDEQVVEIEELTEYVISKFPEKVIWDGWGEGLLGDITTVLYSLDNDEDREVVVRYYYTLSAVLESDEKMYDDYHKKLGYSLYQQDEEE
jgi:hypothetical protein